MLSTQYAEQSLCNGLVSVRLSHLWITAVASLLLGALLAGDVD